MKNGIALTIYNDNFALVRDRRERAFAEGAGTIVFENVAALLDRTTVRFRSLTAPESLVVREQDFRSDTVDARTLLARSIGKQVTVRRSFADGSAREIQGRLLAVCPAAAGSPGNAAGAYVALQTDSGEIVLDPEGEVTLCEMPEGLSPHPRLVWRVDCGAPGDHTVEISYLTEGLNWTADYVAVMSPDGTGMDLTGWVTLSNSSGAAYESAGIQLVAAEARRPSGEPTTAFGDAGAAPETKPELPLEERRFEPRLYTLAGETTLRTNEQKQVNLLAASGAAARKRFIYDGRRRLRQPASPAPLPVEQLDPADYQNQKVSLTLRVENRLPGLGMPLPRGRIRLFQADAEERLQFVGEDWMDHTAANEMLHICVGEAPDLSGEHRRTDFKRLGKRQVEERFEILLRNRRAAALEIVALEHVCAEWEVVNHSHPFQKKDACSIEFPVEVAPNGEVKVSYTIRTRW